MEDPAKGDATPSVEVTVMPLQPPDAQRSVSQRVLPALVLKAARAFQRGVGISSQFREPVMEKWRCRLHDELESVSSEADGLERIESLKGEFLQRELGPRRYRSLLILWAATLVLGGLVVAELFGESSVCRDVHGGFCDEFYGHFIQYIAFRYAMYGALLGFALRISLDEADLTFGKPRAFLTRPALSLILGSVLAYLLARLVAEGKLSVNLFGIAIQRGINGQNGPFFTDSGALFLIGLLSGIASDVLLQRVISNAMHASEEVFRVGAVDPVPTESRAGS